LFVVISFHSLEDRIAKRFIAKHARGDDFPRGLPVAQSQLNPKVKPRSKAIKPSRDEIDRNPRARSAVMRVAAKL
jgi:16S rRNA (cytosine1402-N4)-methyltransferase